MKIIQAKPLTADAFAKYGSFVNLLDDGELATRSVFPQNFFADVLTLNFGTTTLPSVSVCQVRKQEQNVIRALECHKFTCEGLLPLDGDVVIFVGTPAPGVAFSTDTVEAFLVPQGTFVKLNPLILHGTQFPVREGLTHVLCLLPERTFMNDMLMERLSEEQQAEVVIP